MDVIIASLIALLMISLGLLVWTQDYRKMYSFLFFVLTIALSGWIVSSAITNHYFGESQSTINAISNRLAYLFGFLSVALGLLLTYVFPVKRSISRGRMALLLAASLVVGGMSLTSHVAGEVSVSEERLVFSSGMLLPLYASAFLGLIVLLVRNLTSSIKMAGKAVHAQARLLLIAFVTCALAGLTTNVLLPLLGMSVEQTTRFAPLSAIILVVIIAYAIVRHQLFDIRLAAVRGAAYVLSLATLAGVYYLLAYVVSNIFLGQDEGSKLILSPFSVLLALALAFLFQPVRVLFDRLTNRVFFRNTYNIDDFYATLSQILAGTNDLKSLLHQAALQIASTFKANQTFFIITPHEASRRILVGTRHHARLPSADLEHINQYVTRHGDDILTVELLPEHSSRRRILNSHGISLLMPLMKNGEILGYLALGEHRSKGYTRRDIRILGTVADELAVAIQNALSVQQVKDINASLEQRIEMATAELRTSNARLRRIDAAKDEFVSMASHQLRTPLTSIKGYLSMVLEGDVGKITPAQHKVLQEAFISSERMVHLIHDFLNVSRLQTGKFMLEKDSGDLMELVEEEVEALRSVAKARGITLVYQKARGKLPMDVDDTKLRQVLINYIDNALYYSPEGSEVIVKLKRLADRVEVTVTDAGIGVPMSEQAQLFSKFYRATNARKHRPDGTGVGLYLARKVITAHGGDVVFSSKEGKGSTFGFWLPLKHGADKLENKPRKK